LIALHLGVVDPIKDERDTLKAERDKYKVDADKLPDVQKELDGYKNGEDFKAKYEKEHTDFEAYKKQVTDEAEAAKVKAAYRKLLGEEKISDKRYDAIIKVTDFSGMKLDKDGNLENADGLRKKINEDWSEFKVTTRQRTGMVETPPSGNNGSGGLSRAAQLAAKYQAEKYGVRKDADKE
jgi:hypothetical protein